jgi:2-iminobutanoate/2-iminopropanoate deaminase
MVSFTSLFTVALVASSTALALVTPKVAEQPVITYLGTQGPILCMPDQLTLRFFPI